MKTTSDGRPKLTIVCESYWPEVNSTGQLITELAEDLAGDCDVELLTAQPRFNGKYGRRPATEVRNGVRINRLPTTNFAKSSKAGRMANWFSFSAALFWSALRRREPRTYLFLTNPPTAPWVSVLTKALGHPSFVLVFDLYPDLAEAIGAVSKGGAVSRTFDAVNKFAFARCDGLIALGQDMQQRLREKLGVQARVTVIPNWANGDLIDPRPKRESRFARANGLVFRTVFLYAGNLGLFQDLETLIDAVNELPDHEADPLLVFVGNGGKRPLVEEMARQSKRVRVFDYLPYDQLGDLYAAADVGLIALEPGVERTNVPSKTYSILAAGKPFLAVCESSTDLEQLADQGCGVCTTNDTGKVAASMLRYLDEPQRMKAMGAKAREVFDDSFSRATAMEKYRQLLIPNGKGRTSINV